MVFTISLKGNHAASLLFMSPQREGAASPALPSSPAPARAPPRGRSEGSSLLSFRFGFYLIWLNPTARGWQLPPSYLEHHVLSRLAATQEGSVRSLQTGLAGHVAALLKSSVSNPISAC